MNTPLGKKANCKLFKTNISSGQNINDISPLQLFLSNSLTPFIRFNRYNTLSDIKTPFKRDIFSISKTLRKNKNSEKINNNTDENKETSIFKLNLNSKREYKSNNLNIKISIK